ncbi:hypothetical protein BHM03_00010503 [Ensete ventricosum]|nr:hypothetical protein BHM03_00010503 [Ensete ventricosum]
MQLRSLHDRWQVFKGDSSDPKDLLFSVRRSSPLQFKTVLDVFLAANTKEEACDFKMKGSYRKRSCTVYKGDASTVAAQVIVLEFCRKFSFLESMQPYVVAMYNMFTGIYNFLKTTYFIVVLYVIDLSYLFWSI